MRSISVFGLGYVGAVTAACLASKGNEVIGVDVNADKVAEIQAGKAPVLEPGLESLIEANRQAGLLRATVDAATAIEQSEISFLCVGTPSLRNGKLDLRTVEHTCYEVGKALGKKEDFHWVVLRSTIIPGSTESVVIPALEKASGKRAGKEFAVCVNPEFTREGTAVADFLDSPITVLGAAEPSHLSVVRELYAWTPRNIFITSLRAAEMVKYVCNAYHALKVTFANEMGTLCQQLDVDPQSVMEIFTSENKLNISPAYLKPGFAFGGSCLPKDLRALSYRAKELDLKLPLLDAILPSNQEHLDRVLDTVVAIGKKKLGVFGLSFKPGTDDLRESPLVHLIKRLLGEGFQVQVWDPCVSMGRLVGSNRQYIESMIPHIGSLLTDNLEGVVDGAEVILLGTKMTDSERFYRCLRPDQIIVDLTKLDPLIGSIHRLEQLETV